MYKNINQILIKTNKQIKKNKENAHERYQYISEKNRKRREQYTNLS